MKKNKATLLDKVTDLISVIMGSWLGVVLHAIWFATWIYFDFSIEHLTLAVSLEAIFIGIFLLMASNREEAERDRKETHEREIERKVLNEDISFDEKQIILLQSLMNEVKELRKELKTSKKSS